MGNPRKKRVLASGVSLKMEVQRGSAVLDLSLAPLGQPFSQGDATSSCHGRAPPNIQRERKWL
jgi:hypothetical protein